MRARVLALALLGLAGCSSSSAGTSPDAGPHLGSPCQVDDDCLPGPFLCGWPIDGGCDAQGTCNAEVLGPCNDGPVVCACGGGAVVLACIYGPGHSPAPILSSTPGCEFEGGTEPEAGGAPGPDAGPDADAAPREGGQPD